MKVLAVLAAFVALESVLGDEMEIEMVFESEDALQFKESFKRLFDEVLYFVNDEKGQIIYHNPAQEKINADNFWRDLMIIIY